MGENDMQGFGNTPRGKKFFDETMPKIADELELLNKRIGESMGIPKHILEKAGNAARIQDDPVPLDPAIVENKRTLGAILAGLRLLQQEVSKPNDVDIGIMDIATGDREFKALTAEEIDSLSDDLNFL